MTIGTAARSAAVQRGALSIAAAIAVLFFPELLGNLLIYLIGIGALVVGLVELRGWFQSRNPGDLFQALVLIGFGLAVLIGGEGVDRFLPWLIAGVIAIRALRSAYIAYGEWKDPEGDPFWPLATGILSLALAISVIVIPETVVDLVVLVVVGVWILGGVVVLINAIGEDEDTPVPSDVIGVIKSKSMKGELRRQVTESIFEGWDSAEGTVRFAALMSFATAIAAFGIKADSTAVVIGAMLIAPLMSPIMALSASILMGWPKRALYSSWRVALGVLVGVGGGLLMSLISPDFVGITNNTQVLSRVAPTLLDLLIALAAGAAGGYAVTHPEVGNSLPGVAIAVALAPPLAVVGISLEGGELGFAAGAFLLFLTNLVGIVVASGITFILSGYSPWTYLERTGEQGRKTLVLVGIALVLVAFPLAVTGQSIIDAATVGTRAEATVDTWLGDETAFSVFRVQVIGGRVEVVVVGPGETPDPNTLASELAVALDRNIELELRIVPETQFAISANRRGDVTSGSP